MLSQGLFYREFHSFLFLFILFIPIPVFVFYVSQTQWVRNVCISHKERFSSYASLNDLWKAKFNADVFSVVQLVWVSKLIRVVLFCFVFSSWKMFYQLEYYLLKVRQFTSLHTHCSDRYSFTGDDQYCNESTMYYYNIELTKGIDLSRLLCKDMFVTEQIWLERIKCYSDFFHSLVQSCNVPL